MPTEIVKDFYQKGYEVVRRHCPEEVAVVLHDVVVGEWCIANKSAPVRAADDQEKKRIYRLLGDAPLQAWEACSGWIFWSYKLHTPGRSDWDFERAVDAGLLVL